jgi:hypothetical protein
MRPDIARALAEASRYYLLAWRPDPEAKAREKFRRIEVKVKGRPELTVRLQNGYFEEVPKPEKEPAKAEKGGAKNLKAGATAVPPLDPAQEQLRTAINSLTPRAGLPTALGLNYFEGDAGPVLAASVRVEGSSVNFTREGDKLKAEVDVVGVIYDSKGKTEATFSSRLALNAPAARFEGGRTPNVFYNYETKLTPGLHQMRVATRDVKTGRVGSAVQWVEVPNVASRKLALSSLIVAEATADAAPRLTDPAAASKAETLLEPVAAEISVDRRFERTSSLRYLVYIYNASRGGAVPDVTLQTQVFRGRQAVVNAPPARVKTEGQVPARLAYAAEVPLEGLPPGRYSLRVTVNDRASKTTNVQRLSFVVK